MTIHYCHSCGAKNPYVNGVKPKFCSSCGEALETVVAKVKNNSTPSRENGSPGGNNRDNRYEQRSNWKDEWKGKSYAGNIDDDADLNEIMRNLKRETGVAVEKEKMLTVAALKEMDSFNGRDSAPQADKDLAGTRAEIMKNLGVAS
jgi:hypothetical protein